MVFGDDRDMVADFRLRDIARGWDVLQYNFYFHRDITLRILAN